MKKNICISLIRFSVSVGRHSRCRICGFAVTVWGPNAFLPTPRAASSEAHKPSVALPHLGSSSPGASWSFLPHMDHVTPFLQACLIFFFFPWVRNSTSQSLVTWSFPFDMALNNSLEDTEDLYVEHLKTWVGQNFKRSWRAKRNVLGHYLKYKGKEGTNMKKIDWKNEKKSLKNRNAMIHR